MPRVIFGRFKHIRARRILLDRNLRHSQAGRRSGRVRNRHALPRRELISCRWFRETDYHLIPRLKAGLLTVCASKTTHRGNTALNDSALQATDFNQGPLLHSAQARDRRTKPNRRNADPQNSQRPTRTQHITNPRNTLHHRRRGDRHRQQYTSLLPLPPEAQDHISHTASEPPEESRYQQHPFLRHPVQPANSSHQSPDHHGANRETAESSFPTNKMDDLIPLPTTHHLQPHHQHPTQPSSQPPARRQTLPPHHQALSRLPVPVPHRASTPRHQASRRPPPSP